MNKESIASQNATTRMPSLRASCRSDSQPPVILLADDHAETRRSLANSLRQHRFTVHEAATGLELIESAQLDRPDVILLDTRMPDTDGIEAIRELKADPLTATVPIVALAPAALRDEREKCLAAGALRFLTQPVSPDELRRIILSLLTTAPATEATEAVGF